MTRFRPNFSCEWPFAVGQCTYWEMLSRGSLIRHFNQNANLTATGV